MHTSRAMWVLEDELHAEPQGQFESLEGAIVELRHRALLPWNEEPNVAPCNSWSTCGRRYEVVEFDTTEVPWREVSRVRALEVSAEGVKWFEPFTEGVPSQGDA